MSKVSFTEYYLRYPTRLASLSPKNQRLFWEQRKWHPLVRMRWVDETRSNGEGLLTYPDGSIRVYQPLTTGSSIR